MMRNGSTSHSIGFNEFVAYVKNNITVEWAAEKTGVPKPVIERIAREYATAKPANIWIGFGMQRHTNGGAMVRAIDALAAITWQYRQKRRRRELYWWRNMGI